MAKLRISINPIYPRIDLTSGIIVVGRLNSSHNSPRELNNPVRSYYTKLQVVHWNQLKIKSQGRRIE